MKPLLALLLLILCCTAQAQIVGRLNLPDTELLLSTAVKPLARRDSRFTPEEFALVQELTPLIDQARYRQALALLAEREKQQEQPYSPSMLFVRAQLAIQQKDYALARRDLQAALKELPDFVRGHQGMAMLHLARQQWPQAKKALSKAISLGGGDAELYGQLAYIHLRDGSAWAAIAAFQQALMLKPEQAQYQRGLLTALTVARQFPSAQSLVESLLVDSPNESALWLQRANIALQMKDNDLALSSLEAALRLGDRDRDNRMVAAQLHMLKGNYARATALLARNLSGKNWNSGAAGRMFAWLERERQWQHLDKLLKSLRSQIDSMPATQRSDYHLYRGKLALARGQQKTAASAYRAAVSADPANGRALIARAELLLNSGQLTRAELLYTRAKAIAAVREQALLGLAQLFVERQDYPAALELLRTAYQEFPGNTGLRKNIATLSNIVNLAEK